MLDQPGNGLGFRVVQSETRAQLARDPGAGDRMIFRPALGDIVQEHGDKQHLAVLQRQDQVGRQRMVVAGIAALDIGQHADGPDQVLVDRVVVIHVELHHRHDLAEFRHEAAENAGFVHLAQGLFRRVPGSQDRQEKPVRFRVGAQASIDQLQRMPHQAGQLRMHVVVVLVRDLEHPQEVGRIGFEHGVGYRIQAVVLHHEAGRPFNGLGGCRNAACAKGGASCRSGPCRAVP